MIHFCDDMLIIKGIMMTPEIWERAAEDGVESDTWFPVQSDNQWWMVLHDEDDVKGCLYAHTDSSSKSLMLHVNILPAYRKEYYSIFMEGWEFVLTNFPDIIKCNAKIPSCFGSAVAVVKKCGMTEEGVDRMSYIKNGEIHDQIYLGITRPEMESLMKKEAA